MSKINLISSQLFARTKREKDVLQQKNGQLYLRGKVLTPAQRIDLAKQATDLLEMPLVRILLDEMYYLGSKKIFYDSTSTEDLQFGKAVLWVVDILEQKINNLTKLK